MISKERLEELIKENKSVYEIECGEQIAQLNLDSIYCAVTDDCLLFYNYATVFCNLYETKKEAEIHLEFANVERVEKMPYVSWEEANKILNYEPIIEFVGKDTNKYSLYFTDNTINIENSSIDIYKLPATEENYYEALRLAKKLFLG